MRKFFKILAIIISLLLLVTLALYLYATDFGRRELLTNAPKKAKYEVPITYTTGWWAYQDSLSVNSLDVEVEESKLNVFNNRSLISYRISGEIKYAHWLLKIKEVHVSERMINDTTLNYNRIIELTPIVATVKQDKESKGGVAKFNFKNEHLVYSTNWGTNRIKFVCGDREQIIELKQRK